MDSARSRPRLAVTCDGRGVVAHAGAQLLADLVQATAGGVQRGPGPVALDVAATLADSGETISDLAVLRDRPDLFGKAASPAAAWRVRLGIDAGTLPRLRASTPRS